MDKELVIHITHTHNGILFNHKNGSNHAICVSMNEPWRLYAKWKVRQRQKSTIDRTYMWNLKEKKTKENKWYLCLPEVGGVGGGRIGKLSKGTNIQLQDK